MYIVLIIFHVLICLFLIATILLQTGRGAGLTEMFGGEATQSLLGTQAPKILKTATEISAGVFIVTSLLLGMITARTGRSLFDVSEMPVMPFEQGAPFFPDDWQDEDLDGSVIPADQPAEAQHDLPELPAAEPIPLEKAGS